ncbi:lactose-binding lectin l-2-like [Sphaeramia orbicularis]|uniref:lactose-binding lectin l-2-like n=1 Tax=Sphaeramia orbicularis TaxID=375764 RepID=UPI00117FEFB7|nr:lactose-binding lectin l-2-like [Sphaeramia orbicularis]
MLFFIFLSVLALGVASPPGDGEVKLEQGSCLPSWYTFKGRCYKYVATELTWADAELHCVSQWATLVSIHSLEEHNFVKSLIQNFDHAQGHTWIGLSDTHKEGAWMWSDGCPVDYVLWDKGQPDNHQGNEDCVGTNYGESLKWNDMPCSEAFPSVCAFRNPCPRQ